MMFKFYSILFILGFTLTSFTPTSQDVSERIARYIESGNAKGLSTYFADNVDMKIEDKQNIYSKAQATLVLQNFFNKNRPTDFKLIHKGTSQRGMEYRIGRLSTSSTQFRVTFHLKPKGNGFLISQFSIEKA